MSINLFPDLLVLQGLPRSLSKYTRRVPSRVKRDYALHSVTLICSIKGFKFIIFARIMTTTKKTPRYCHTVTYEQILRADRLLLRAVIGNRIHGFLRPDVSIFEILEHEGPARSARLACDHPRRFVSSRIHVAKSVVMLPAFWVCLASVHQQPVFLRLRQS